MAISRRPPNEIMAFLRSRQGANQYKPYNYLAQAFLKGNTFMYVFPPGPMDANQERLFTELMLERRSEWEVDEIPELMRLRDYYAFLQFARDEDVIVLVCGANPAAGQYIGRSHFRCYQGDAFVISRREPPNEGLIAADPGDSSLLAALAQYEQPITYPQYVASLTQQGHRVLGSDEGYVIQDSDGYRLHEAYRLHGVYDRTSGESAWTAKRGERLRGILNRLLGEELIRSGPHDAWEHRNDRRLAGPLFGPQAPAIEFSPNQQIGDYLETRDIGRSWPYALHWTRLYPHHFYSESDSGADQ